METKANYVLIGVFTLATAAALLLFGLWAAKYSSERNWQQYQVVFTEPVTGLSEGSSVQYNGIGVGTVETLDLDPGDPRRVIARLKLKSEVPVKVDTRAKMSITGLTGLPLIRLGGGSPRTPRLVDVDHRDAPVILTEASALQNIADTANRLVARLDQVLSEENVKRINDTLIHIEAATGAIAGERDDLRTLIVNARQASEQLNTTLATTNRTLGTVDRELVDKLPALVGKLDTTLSSLDAAANNANGMLGENRAAIHNFANGGLAQVGPTLAELRALVRDLRHISDQLEAGSSPARYIFGREKPKEFEPK